MVIPLVSVQKDLGFPNPATLPTGECFCSMHCLDVMVEVGIIFQDCVTDGTSCDSPFVDDFFMLNPALIIRAFEATVIDTGKHRLLTVNTGEESYILGLN